MNPTFGIVGDAMVTELPATAPDQNLLLEERRRAKFSRTAEFKKLKEEIDQRINFYQQQLPDGRVITEVNTEERGQQWVIANAVIGELRRIVSVYEDASEVVDAAQRG